MTSSIDHRISQLEARLGTVDGHCHCPDRERFIPVAHVDMDGVLWYCNPDVCPACGGSTVPDGAHRVSTIRMDQDTATSVDQCPFGGYDRWWPWGPPPGRKEEVIPTGVSDSVTRTREGTTIRVPIDQLGG